MTTASMLKNPILVAWCRYCEHYLPITEAGRICPGCDWILLKRRRYICYECELRDSFAAQYDYDKHLEWGHEDSDPFAELKLLRAKVAKSPEIES